VDLEVAEIFLVTLNPQTLKNAIEIEIPKAEIKICGIMACLHLV
jgi:hypothetical protein